MNAEDRPPKSGRHVAEAHPAVAIWLWCRNQRQHRPWEYKKHKKHKATRDQLWRVIEGFAGNHRPHPPPKDDDEFDAYVAYLLGTMWLARNGVILLGNEKMGSFLVPNEDGLDDAFNNFTVAGS